MKKKIHVRNSWTSWVVILGERKIYTLNVMYVEKNSKPFVIQASG